MNGKKTYAAVAGVILAAAGAFLQGDMTLGAAVTAILGGLGVAGLRHGVKKTEE